MIQKNSLVLIEPNNEGVAFIYIYIYQWSSYVVKSDFFQIQRLFFLTPFEIQNSKIAENRV